MHTPYGSREWSHKVCSAAGIVSAPAHWPALDPTSDHPCKPSAARMFRAACNSLLRQEGLMRGISTSAAMLEEAAPAGVKEFTEAWSRIAPSTMNLPEFPSAHLAPETARDAAADGDQFPVNFYTPNGVVAEGKVCDWDLLSMGHVGASCHLIWLA